MRHWLSAVLLAGTVFSAHADDADRELLMHGYRQWNDLRDLLIARKNFIQDDLVAVLNSPSWQAREFAAVVQLMAKDPAAFAAETARGADIRGIYLKALGIDDIPRPPWIPDAPTWIDPLTLALRRRQGPPPAQHVPWPVLVNAARRMDYYKNRLVLLHFWAEPRQELLRTLWGMNFTNTEEWVLEQGILALGPAAIPFLAECVQETAATTARSSHFGLAPRLLEALGDRRFFPDYRQRLVIPPIPENLLHRDAQELRSLHGDSLAGMEILAQHRDAEALPLIVRRFEDFLRQRQDEGTSSTGNDLGGDRPSAKAVFPDAPTNDADRDSRFTIDRLAGALAVYGSAAVPLLKEARAALLRDFQNVYKGGYADPRPIDTADALIAYLTASDDQARRIAALRWNAVRSVDLATFLEWRRLSGESLAPFVDTRPWFFAHLPEDGLARLAASGDSALVPALARWCATKRKEFSEKATEAEQKRGPGTIDAQLLREHAGAMLSAQKATEHLLAADAALLTIIQLGGPSAIGALRNAATDAPWTKIATSGILACEGRLDALADTLAAVDVATAESAALVLWAKRDVRAQAQLLLGAARRRGDEHQAWLRRARDLGPLEAALARLPATARADFRVGILMAALAEEAARPAAAIAVRSDLEHAANQVSLQHVWTTAQIVAAGRGLTDPASKQVRLGAEARAILEAECLFGIGVIRRGVAANALAALGDERSLPVIVAAADMGAPGGTNPVVPALESFGARGAELLTKVPKLVPAQADTGLQVTMHRYKTLALADLGEIRAVEPILEGLATLEADRQLEDWEHRAGIYLDAAAKCTDDRLIEPLLRFSQFEHIGHRALVQLDRYADQRCEDALLAALRTGIPPQQWGERHDQVNGVATQALMRRWGTTALQRLVALATGNDARMRAMVGLVLADLSLVDRAYNSAVQWPTDLPQRDNLVRTTREATLPILTAGLVDPDPLVNLMAATAMTTFIGGAEERSHFLSGKRMVLSPRVVGDVRGVPLLTAWVQRGGDPDYAIIDCLGREGDEATGVMMLGLLAKGRAWLAEHRAGGIIHAIGNLRPPGAIAALEKIIVEPPDDDYDLTAMDALILQGADGHAVLSRLQREATSHRRRSVIAERLANAKALDPILIRQQLDACLAAADSLEFTQLEKSREAWEWACEKLFSALAIHDPELARLASAPMLRQGSDSLRGMTLQTLSWAYAQLRNQAVGTP